MNFDQAFVKLIDVEKGFQRDPADNGNWTGGRRDMGRLKGTKYGISAAAYPEEDIENLTLERAKDLYRRDYWGPAGCDAVPVEVKFPLFDTAVNAGVMTSIRLLQRAACVSDDGVLGPKTLQAVQSMPPLRLLLRFTGHRHRYNVECRSWKDHGGGWTRRVADLQLEA